MYVFVTVTGTWSCATAKVLWLSKKCIQMLASILALHACPYGMVWLAPCQTPNPQPGGLGIFCWGILPLTTSAKYLKALEARLTPLSLSYIVLPGSPNVEVWHMTCWQSLFLTVGHSGHFWELPSGNSSSCWDLLPAFDPTESFYNVELLIIQTVAEERNRKILPGNVGEKTNCWRKDPRGVSELL